MREWCTGYPPKAPFLGAIPDSPPRASLSRRSTLADRPELDHQLAETMVFYHGYKCLPLTVHTIHRLSPFWKGVKPIANYGLFKRVIIDKEINFVHPDHAIAALTRIGQHCKHLVIIAPIHTSDLGDVFNREALNINTGNDWDEILRCLPNLDYVTFEHPEDESAELTRKTYTAFVQALSGADSEYIKSVNVRIPPRVMASLNVNVANGMGNGGALGSLNGGQS